MSRFKIINKMTAQYGAAEQPDEFECEFRTWDERSAIFGVGLRADPGNITHLSVSGRTLNETTGKLQGDAFKKGSDAIIEVTIELPQGPTADSSVLTGLGFRANPGSIQGLKIWTVDISRGFTPEQMISVPGPTDGPNRSVGAPIREYMVGSGVEQQVVLDPGYLAVKLTTRADPGTVTNAWAEWGKILRGNEVSAEGFLASVNVRVDSQRVELSLVSGDPINWYFNLNESLSTQMLLLSHAREAVIHSTRVQLAGVHWTNELSAEAESITLFGSAA